MFLVTTLFWLLQELQILKSALEMFRTDVEAVVHRLHSGKSDGYSGLMSEHINSACDDLFVYVALLFSGMIVHGFVPDDL